MTKTIENLLKNSRLPGPRGNLELLFSFVQNATESEINACLAYDREDLKNCPEEFVMTCGIVGYCILKPEGFQECNWGNQKICFSSKLANQRSGCHRNTGNCGK
jgi:hypothetical protein